MKLSTRVRYATRIMLDLARSGSSHPVLGQSIADRQGISKSYLDNLIMPLKTAGLIRTIRSAGGGLVLNKSPSHIKVSNIWEAMEGPLNIIDCIHEPDLCPRHDQCVTRDIWEEVKQTLESVFESWSLEDMIHQIKIV